jgi:hypothetical protein
MAERVESDWPIRPSARERSNPTPICPSGGSQTQMRAQAEAVSRSRKWSPRS